MADNSHIEWTDATWNPLTGCSIKSPGCIHCYAMTLAGTRLKDHPSRAGLTKMTKNGPVWTGEIRFNEQWLDQPRKWHRPREIFVCAHSDLFHPNVEYHHFFKIMAVIHDCSWHAFQILTKRSDIMLSRLAYFPPLPHAWVGVSVERQREADERRADLAQLAALGWNTWVSYEPALGPIDWTGWEFVKGIVSGGESGPRSRPSHPRWHQHTRDWCATRDIPYHLKQWGDWAPISILTDEQIDGCYRPSPLRRPLATRKCKVPAIVLHFDGDCLAPNSAGAFTQGSGAMTMLQIGKKVAGALLDGREHRELPWRQSQTSQISASSSMEASQ